MYCNFFEKKQPNKGLKVKPLLNSLLVLLSSFLITACSADCFKPTGEIVQERRLMADFSEINLYDNLDLVLRPLPSGETPFIEVEAGSKLQSSIKAEVRDGVLYLRNTAGCNWVRNNNKARVITVHYPVLKALRHYGFGLARSQGVLQVTDLLLIVEGQGDIDLSLVAQNLECRLFERGDIRLRGVCTGLNVATFNHGFLYAQDLTARHISAVHEGEGDFHLRATEQLDVQLRPFSIGTIFYYGQPVVTNFDIAPQTRGRIRAVNPM